VGSAQHRHLVTQQEDLRVFDADERANSASHEST
jgi:hypothetical protein